MGVTRRWGARRRPVYLYMVRNISGQRISWTDEHNCFSSLDDGAGERVFVLSEKIIYMVQSGELEVTRPWYGGGGMRWTQAELDLMKRIAEATLIRYDLGLPSLLRDLETLRRFKALTFRGVQIWQHPIFAGRTPTSIRLKLRDTLSKLDGRRIDLIVQDDVPEPEVAVRDMPPVVVGGSRRVEDGVIMTPGVKDRDW